MWTSVTDKTQYQYHPGSQMGRGHQFKDCPFEAMLHAAGSRSDFRNRRDARFVFHVCGTTEEVFQENKQCLLGAAAREFQARTKKGLIS